MCRPNEGLSIFDLLNLRLVCKALHDKASVRQFLQNMLDLAGIPPPLGDSYKVMLLMGDERYMAVVASLLASKWHNFRSSIYLHDEYPGVGRLVKSTSEQQILDELHGAKYVVYHIRIEARLTRRFMMVMAERELIAHLPEVIRTVLRSHPRCPSFSSLQSDNLVHIAGSYSLNKYLIATGESVSWIPHDIDIFFPYGDSSYADDIWTAVSDWVLNKYRTLAINPFSRAQTIIDRLVHEYEGETYRDVDISSPLSLLSQGSQVAVNTSSWERPAQRRYPTPYTTKDIRDCIDDLNTSPEWSFLQENRPVGIPRPYRVYRSVHCYKEKKDNDLCFFLGGFDKPIEDEHRPWHWSDRQFYRPRINLVQYRGDPLDLDVFLSSFDILPCQVAIKIDGSSPFHKYSFCLSKEVENSIKSKTLILSKYAWPPIYTMDSDSATRYWLDLHVHRTIGRIQKYMDRGFGNVRWKN